jgi:hypothetical protein
VVHCKHSSGRSVARRGLEASLPRMPRAKEEALSIGQPVIPQRPTLNVSRESADMPGASGAWLDTAGVLVRSVVMVALAALAILVLLPAAVAAQAAVSN